MAEQSFAEFKLQTQNDLDNHEGRIVENSKRFGELSNEISNLRNTVTEVTNGMVRTIGAAQTSLEQAISKVQVGDPPGYEDLKSDISQLNLRQNTDITPYVTELKNAGLNRDSWSNMNLRVNTLANNYNTIPTIQTDISLTLINSVTKANGGRIINSRVQDGMSLVRFILEDDNRTDMLTGYWFKDGDLGSGIFSSREGNAFIVKTTGVTLTVETAVMGNLNEDSDSGNNSGSSTLPSNLLTYLQSLANTTLNATTWTNMANDVSKLKSTTTSSVPLVDVGTVSLSTGGNIITNKTSNGISAVKMTLGGVVMEGPWVREGSHGYGLMINNSTGGVLSVLIDGAGLKTYEVSTGGGTGNAGVNLELDTVSESIVGLGNRIDNIESVIGTLSRINGKTFYEILSGSSNNSGGGSSSGGSGENPGDSGGTTEKQTPTLSLSDFQQIGTTYTATITYNGDGQLSADLGSVTNNQLTVIDADGTFNGTLSATEGTNYKAASITFSHTGESSSGSGGGNTDPKPEPEPTADDPFANYTPSETAQVMLDFVQKLAENTDKDSWGASLLNYGLSAVTKRTITKSLQEFYDMVCSKSYVDEVLTECGIDLNNNDTGSILGIDAGGTITFSPNDIIKKDSSITPSFPIQVFNFQEDTLKKGNPYAMRKMEIVTGKNGTEDVTTAFLVQPPEELTTGKQDVIAKSLWWYIPQGIKLVKIATGLSLSSATSHLMIVPLLSVNNEPLTFKVPAVVIAFDQWEEGCDLHTMSNNEYVYVNSCYSSSLGKSPDIVIQVNGNYFASVSNNDGKGNNGALMTFDRVMVGAIAKATLACNISNFEYFPRWFQDGIAHLIYGIDDQMKTEIEDILSGQGNDSDRFLKGVNYNYDAYSDVSSENYSTVGKATDPGVIGYLFLRWLFKTIAKENAEEKKIIESLSPAAKKMRQFMQRLADFTFTENQSPLSMMDIAINDVSGGAYKNIATLKESLFSALTASLNKRESADTFLKRECNIDLNNIDSGSIIGADAGGNVVYSPEDILLEPTGITPTMPTKVLKLPAGLKSESVVMKDIQGIKFTFTNPDLGGLTGDEKYGLSLVATWHIDLALSLIWKALGLKLNSSTSNYSYGIHLMLDNSTGQYSPTIISPAVIHVCYDDDPLSIESLYGGTDGGVTAQCQFFRADKSLKCLGCFVLLNDYYYKELEKGNLNGKGKNMGANLGYMDRTIAHELTHGVQACNYVGFGEELATVTENNVEYAVTEPWPKWFTEGSAELVCGIDTIRPDEMRAVCSSRARLEKALQSENIASVYVNGVDPYSGGVVFLRYIAKKLAEI